LGVAAERRQLATLIAIENRDAVVAAVVFSIRP
jgi:hypothetical protein